MKIVILGYGRVGSRTLEQLIPRGHEITLIDKEAIRLGQAANLAQISLVQGNGIDVEVQQSAGMGSADLLLAVTRDDNVNLMAAEVARAIFNVPRAIARVYEPSHAEACHDPQLLTVCPTLTAVDGIVDRVDELAGQPVGVRAPAPPVYAPPETRRGSVDDSKFIIIIGAGKVGINLARSLYDSGHEIAMVESNPTRVAQLAPRVDFPMIVGDGSIVPVLEAAGASRARVFVAVTGSDQDNLIACQIARRVFGVPKTVARASNPRNESVMQTLGVDTTVSSTAIIEQVIERELPTMRFRTLLHLEGGKIQIIEYLLDEKSPVVGQPLRAVGFPVICNIVAIQRGGSTIIPRGETILEPGDMVIALVDRESEPELRRTLAGEV
ncbi:MAG: NAD-binding protein [Acidobacteria bacterium]|nr:NAD-binding protein [Acidobacteriota bacterium]